MSDLARKLGIVPGAAILLFDVPESVAALLRDACPPGVTFAQDKDDTARYDLILFWPQSADGLAETFDALQWRIIPDGSIWTLLLKKPIARQRGITLTWEQMQTAALHTDLVDNKIASISDEAYGTRFVIRRERRPSYAASPRRPSH